MIKLIRSAYILIILLLIVSFPVIVPLFHPGYFPTHDGEWAVVRLGDMFRSLRDRQFPVRYSGYLNFGYGYPLFNFTYPAPYYLGMFFYLFKLGFVNSIKVIFGLSVLVSGVGMYLLGSQLWKNRIAGVVCGIFYVYFPYRIVDLYARGSIGESLSFALFPIILYCASNLYASKKIKLNLIAGSICYALLVLSHNIMALLFTPVLLVFMVANSYFRPNKNYLISIVFILLSYCLSAFFWVPAILEEHNIRLSIYPIADRSIYFVNLSQLITPKWGYGLPNQLNGFTYQLGIPQIIILLAMVVTLLYIYFKKRNIIKTLQYQQTMVLTLIIIIYILLMFSFTSFIWQYTPLLKDIDYPWTLLGPLGFLISVVSGYLWLQHRFIKIFLILLCILTVILVLPHAKPSEYFNKGDVYYLTNDATTTSSDELMPLWVKTFPTQLTNNKVVIVKGKGTVSNISYNSHKISFAVDLDSNGTIRINTIYYPGWKIALDGTVVPISDANSLGVMDISVPKGKHLLVGNFTETPLRLFSDILSIIGILCLGFIAFFNIKLLNLKT